MLQHRLHQVLLMHLRYVMQYGLKNQNAGALLVRPERWQKSCRVDTLTSLGMTGEGEAI